MKGFIWEGIGIVGIGLTFGGIWWLEPPLALIFLGVACIVVALIGARDAARRKPPQETDSQE